MCWGGEQPSASSTSVSVPNLCPTSCPPPHHPDPLPRPQEHLSCRRLQKSGCSGSPGLPVPSGTMASSPTFFVFLFVCFFWGGGGRKGVGELHLSVWVLGNKTLQKALRSAASTSRWGYVG